MRGGAVHRYRRACTCVPRLIVCWPLPPPASLQYLRMPGERIMKHAEELYQQVGREGGWACSGAFIHGGSLCSGSPTTAN